MCMTSTLLPHVGHIHVAEQYQKFQTNHKNYPLTGDIISAQYTTHNGQVIWYHKATDNTLK